MSAPRQAHNPHHVNENSIAALATPGTIVISNTLTAAAANTHH
jgi:hypothetical protein